MGWLSDVGNWVSDTVSDAVETVGDVAVGAVRTVGMVGQGIVRGVASTAGTLVDVGKLAYNGVAYVGNQVGADIGYAELGTGGRWADGVTIMEPRNAWERGVMSVSQAGTEVVAFVGITVATAGAGGALVGGTAGAARAAATTARFVSPIASRTAAVVEGGFATYSAVDTYLDETERARTISERTEEAILDGLGERTAEIEALAAKNTEIADELSGILDQLESGGLSAERRAELERNMTTLFEAADMIEELADQEEPPSEERRQELYQQLNEHLNRIDGIEPISYDEAAAEPDPLLLSADNEPAETATTGFDVAAADNVIQIQFRDPELALAATNLDPASVYRPAEFAA